jgi:two-component system sensor histidine kinase and response regulator WspE
MAEDLSGFSMLELFRLEADSQTAVLSAGVLAIEELERSPSTVESLMRAAHSLKGAARIVGLDSAVRVAHALEDVFVAAGKGQFRVRPEHADLLLAAVDFLAAIARADDALVPESPWPAQADDLVDRLAAILVGAPPSAPHAGSGPATPQAPEPAPGDVAGAIAAGTVPGPSVPAAGFRKPRRSRPGPS